MFNLRGWYDCRSNSGKLSDVDVQETHLQRRISKLSLDRQSHASHQSVHHADTIYGGHPISPDIDPHDPIQGNIIPHGHPGIPHSGRHHRHRRRRLLSSHSSDETYKDIHSFSFLPCFFFPPLLFLSSPSFSFLPFLLSFYLSFFHSFFSNCFSILFSAFSFIVCLFSSIALCFLFFCCLYFAFFFLVCFLFFIPHFPSLFFPKRHFLSYSLSPFITLPQSVQSFQLSVFSHSAVSILLSCPINLSLLFFMKFSSKVNFFFSIFSNFCLLCNLVFVIFFPFFIFFFFSLLSSYSFFSFCFLIFLYSSLLSNFFFSFLFSNYFSLLLFLPPFLIFSSSLSRFTTPLSLSHLPPHLYNLLSLYFQFIKVQTILL
ncbi:unnamed protein product [Acanthosepion pharaonis]|uniref:Uncharacterized protein n=1 Tax=Acanthosepion pharaonis TaxID=158019 RepID=A0A812ESY6_ACAPH|nr:unnamed protein product [Sepia pharaonis]